MCSTGGGGIRSHKLSACALCCCYCCCFPCLPAILLKYPNKENLVRMKYWLQLNQTESHLMFGINCWVTYSRNRSHQFTSVASWCTKISILLCVTLPAALVVKTRQKFALSYNNKAVKLTLFWGVDDICSNTMEYYLIICFSPFKTRWYSDTAEETLINSSALTEIFIPVRTSVSNRFQLFCIQKHIPSTHFYFVIFFFLLINAEVRFRKKQGGKMLLE